LIPLGILLVVCFRLDFAGLDGGGESDLTGLLIVTSTASPVVDFNSRDDCEGPVPKAMIGKGSGRGFNIGEVKDDPANRDFELESFIVWLPYASLFFPLDILDGWDSAV
jgi:hypothetical protein